MTDMSGWTLVKRVPEADRDGFEAWLASQPDSQYWRIVLVAGVDQ